MMDLSKYRGLVRPELFGSSDSKVPPLFAEATSLARGLPHSSLVMLGLADFGSPKDGSASTYLGVGFVIRSKVGTSRLVTAAHVLHAIANRPGLEFRVAFETKVGGLIELAASVHSARFADTRQGGPDLATLDVIAPVASAMQPIQLVTSPISAQNIASWHVGMLAKVHGRNLLNNKEAIAFESNRRVLDSTPLIALSPVSEVLSVKSEVLHDASSIPSFSGAPLLARRDASQEWQAYAVHLASRSGSFNDKFWRICVELTGPVATWLTSQDP